MTKHTDYPVLGCRADDSNPSDWIGIVLDVPELLHGGTVITASSGGGKTYAERKILEETYGVDGLIHLVFDPEGELHTLREKLDYVLAGPGGDCAATLEQAPLLARRMLQYRFSLIVNLYDLGMRRADYVKAFLEAMMLAPRELDGDVLVVLEEAQLFVPERGEAPASSEHAVKDFMARGRKRGWRPILSTQRLASISKTAAALCQNSLIGLTTLDDDQDRAAKRLGFRGKGDWRDRLASLEPGHFFAVGPAFGCPKATEIVVGAVQTSHGRMDRKRTATPPRASLARVLAKLADLPQEARNEASAVDRLRARVAELEAQVEGLDGSAELEEIAEHNGKTADKLAKALEAEEAKNTALDNANADLHQKLDEVAEKLKTLAGSVGDLVQEVEDVVSANYHLHNDCGMSEPEQRAFDEGEARKLQAFAQVTAPPKRPASGNRGVHPGGPDGAPAVVRNLLGTLAHIGPLSKAQMLLYANYASSGDTSKAFARMTAEGWMESNQTHGKFMITAAATRAFGELPRPLRRQALREAIAAGLSTVQAAIFNTVCTHPSGITKGEVLRMTDYKSSGDTSKAFALLVRRGWIINTRATLTPAKELFQ